ncbi:MAG TPA: TolC family protein [Verrucomicrobiae bacterium]|nr:TolC family protein [Verrucomicrobiae bacterium]
MRSRARALGVLLALFAATQGAWTQPQDPPPVLTVDGAVALAMKGNRELQVYALDIDRSREGTAAIETQRLPQFNFFALGGEALRPISFTIPEGALGIYPNVGPIPAQSASITTPQKFTGLLLGQISEPLTQQWKIHLASLSSRLTEQLARERLEQQKQDVAHSVRDLFYQLVQIQAEVDSAESNVKYLVELQAEMDRNLAEQSVLKGDSLAVRAKLSRQRYQLLSLHDQLAMQKESMNRLLGRDLDTDFTVEAEPIPGTSEIDLKDARSQAARQRPEIHQAQLQTKKADVEVRRQRAEYIPDLSLHFTYLAFPNVNFVPQNIMEAGFLFQWQPFDWGQKRHKTEALRDAARQASISEQDTVQQVMLDVDAKFRGLAEARALLDTTALSQEAEREKLRVVTNRYGQKSALLSDVLQQEASVTQADADYRNALAAFWKAKAGFDRALGKE